MLERSKHRAWWVPIAGLVPGLIGIAAVFVQGPLRRVVEIPIVVDRVTGEATIQQRLTVETIPPMETLDKHNLATLVRAREGYNWMFLQRDSTRWQAWRCRPCGLTLAPTGEAQNVLTSDDEHMVEDGLLLYDAEPFESLLERCQALAEKGNAKVLAEW